MFLCPRHTKYVEGYIVFVFPSIRPSFRPGVRPVLTFYVKVLREVFFIHQEMALVVGIRAPLGTCSSLFTVYCLLLDACCDIGYVLAQWHAKMRFNSTAYCVMPTVAMTYYVRCTVMCNDCLLPVATILILLLLFTV